jgi:hypothetical protein
VPPGVESINAQAEAFEPVRVRPTGLARELLR